MITRITVCLSIVFIILSGNASANPVGGVVSHGSANIVQSDTQTTIQQNSQQAIINWQSFNIGANEKTHFQQPQGGVALNRISATQGPSQIYGQLTATGKIILVNQAGIFFGPSAYVNVGGIIASTSNISDQNFLAGKLVFDQPSPFNASIINKGMIIAAQNGLVALLGNNITNDGLIQAEMGNILLGSGNKFTIDLYGDQLVSFTVDEATTTLGTDENNQLVSQAINNSGTLLADGGSILITAKSASNVMNNVINMSGIAEAHSVDQQQGEIILSGDAPVPVLVSGLLDASGTNANQIGGTVKILGNTIHLSSTAEVNVSGVQGGGEILVGGNFHGKGPEQNALNTSVDSGAVLNANALENGNGGQIAVWSNGNTLFYGNISAKAGINGGNGGFVETSGHYLDVNDIQIDLSASKGEEGTWLLDPSNIYIAANQANATAAGMSGSDTSANTISGGSAAASGAVQDSLLTTSVLNAALASSNVTVTTTNANGTGVGDINIVDPITWTSGSTLFLTAANNININAIITTGTSASLLSLTAPGTISQTAAIKGSGGLTKSGAGSATLSQVNTYTGTTTINSGTLFLSGTGSITNSIVSIAGGIFDISNTSGTTIVALGATSGSTKLGAQTLTISGSVSGGFYAGTISGNGGGIVLKAGSETFTKANTYTGATTINGGTLTVSNAAALGTGAGGVTISSGGSLFLNSISLNVGTINLQGGSLAGNTSSFNGNIILGSNSSILVSGPSASGTLALNGTISGNFGISFEGFSGGGTVTLSGLNTYSGTTSITSLTGALSTTLALGTTGSIANSSVNVSSTGTFDISGTTSGASIVALTGSGATNLGTKTLTLSNATGTYSGVLSGTGGLTLSAGNLTLSGTNTYTGVTTINGGVLSVATIGNGGVAGNLGQASNAASNLILNNGTLQYTGLDASTDRAFTITNGATGSFDITTNNLTLSAASASTSGGLTKLGNGTLTLSGTNTYTGATTINAGMLTIGSSSTGSGTITNGPVGIGSIILNGGTLASSGNFSIANPFSMTASSIIGGSNAITLNGTGTLSSGILTVNNTNTTTLSNNLSGSGKITQNAGILLVSASDNSNYQGTTTLNAGTLQVGASGVLGSGSLVFAGGTLTSSSSLSLTNTFSMTASSIIGGSNAITLNGTGTLSSGILTVNNTNTTTLS
ncbi:MAG: filamentous hemagglutinin N-terminal domain-containing protein, partial [Gammaproteobacteria bacterium]|nr:filamentous hemagglutinin N-terminal domain-containing protein [Gammaproteobacteria bacterium]